MFSPPGFYIPVKDVVVVPKPLLCELFSCLAVKIIKQVACMCLWGLTSPFHAGVAQMVERQFSKLNVVGSSPISRFL
jgi:hypothetical protein